MNFENFKSEVKKALGKVLGKDYEVTIHKVTKVNVETEQITFRKLSEEKSSLPSIGLEPYFEKYQNGLSIETIADEIARLYRESEIEAYRAQKVADVIMDYELAKETIVYELINYELNRQLLENVPYERFLDLAIICRCDFSDMSSIVKNEFLQLWNISEHELFEVAKINTPKRLPYEFAGMADVVSEMLGTDEFQEECENVAMYVLTNQSKCYGASCILYDNLLKSISDKFDCDLCIIPSSIHETILIPMKGQVILEEVNEMIKEVNETQVAEGEILSNHCYIYYRDVDSIDM